MTELATMQVITKTFNIPLYFEVSRLLKKFEQVDWYIVSSPEPKAHRRAYRILMVRSASAFTMLKDLLLRNRFANQSQILCGASLGRGKVILFAASGSHYQDGGHARIW